MVRVAIVAATGGVGKEALRQALDAGHDVIALVRRPEAVPLHDRLTVVGGDVRDDAALDKLLPGAAIVLSCLGNRRGEPKVVAEGTALLLKAMKRHQVPRLAFISSMGVGDSFDQCLKMSWVFTRLIIPCFLKSAMLDLEAAEEAAFAESSVTTVAVRPPGLSDAAPTGAFGGRGATEEPGFPRIPRGDVAGFMVSLVDDRSWDGKAVSVFPKPTS